MSDEKQQWRKTVGSAIRRQRLALGQGQADVALAIGASPASISNWERGEGTLSAFRHAQLTSYFAAEFAKLPTKSKPSDRVSA